MNSSKIIGVIPARYGSTRLEAKPLVDLWGKPLIYYVYKQAKKCKLLSEVIVATDNEQIVKAVKSFGGKAMMTSLSCQSGTDRMAEVAIRVKGDIFVNIQGDEPFMNPKTIEESVRALLNDKNKEAMVSTAMIELKDKEEINNPNVVKVVVDKDGFALYFSRSPIPFVRNKIKDTRFFKHLGIYVYRKDFLLKFAKMKPTVLQQTESLEQLKVLENGYKIKVVETEFDSIGIDTEEDLNKARRILKDK